MQLDLYCTLSTLKYFVVQPFFSGQSRRRLFPFRKRSLPFLTVDAIFGNQAFSRGRRNIGSGINYNEVTETFLNSLRKNKVYAQVKVTFETRERAMVTYYRCIIYERQLIIIYTSFLGGLWRIGVVV